MLVDTAREFLAAKSPVQAQRALRDNNEALGFDGDLWQQMVELGWGAIPFPESLGGFEFGYKGMGAVFEELGRHLSASPMLSSIALSATLLQYLGSEAQQSEWLSAMISGEKRLALAVDEDHRHDPAAIALAAVADADGYRLSDNKVVVLDGVDADGWIVAARTSGAAGDSDGISLFLVPVGTDGVTVTRQSLIDARKVARLSLDNVSVPAGNLLGEAGQGMTALDQALDRGRLCLAAEMVVQQRLCLL